MSQRRMKLPSFIIALMAGGMVFSLMINLWQLGLVRRANSVTRPGVSVSGVSEQVSATPDVGASPGSPSSARSVVLPDRMFMPVKGKIIAKMGWRKDPVYGDWRYHTGYDIEAPAGSPVYAALPGKVTAVGATTLYGLGITLEHAGGLSTFYGYCEDVLVRGGEEVAAGQAIARVSSSEAGNASHLHFEVSRDGQAVDPGEYLK